MARTAWHRCAPILVALLGLALLAAPSAQAAATNSVAYPAVPMLASDGHYTVTADGQAVPVSTYIGNSFAWMSYSGTAQIKVTFSAPVTSKVISPQSSGIAVTVSGNTLSFAMASAKKFVLSKVNGSTTQLFLFADAPETGAPIPGAAGVFTAAPGPAGLQNAINSASAYPGGGTVYVPAGDDILTTTINLKSNVKLYLAPRAILDLRPTTRSVGMFRISGTNNVKIFGRGAFYAGANTDIAQVLGHQNSRLNLYDVMMVAAPGTFLRLGNSADSGVHNMKIL